MPPQRPAEFVCLRIPDSSGMQPSTAWVLSESRQRRPLVRSCLAGSRTRSLSPAMARFGLRSGFASPSPRARDRQTEFMASSVPMNRLPTPYDARTAYLLQCGNEELFAVSPDKAGDAIPMSGCAQGWLFRQDFPSGVQEPLPVAYANRAHRGEEAPVRWA